MAPRQKVVVAIKDGSAKDSQSIAALQWVISVLVDRERDYDLVLLHVIRGPEAERQERFTLEELKREASRRDEMLGEYRQVCRQMNVQVETIIRHSFDRQQGIVAEVRESGATHLVMGTGGPSSRQSTRHGETLSLTARVAELVSCSMVLIDKAMQVVSYCNPTRRKLHDIEGTRLETAHDRPSSSVPSPSSSRLNSEGQSLSGMEDCKETQVCQSQICCTEEKVPSWTEDYVELYDIRGSFNVVQQMPPTAASALQTGSAFTFYYPFDNDSLALLEKVRSALAASTLPHDSYELEHAPSDSSIIYLYVFRTIDKSSIEQLVKAVCVANSGAVPTITYANGAEAYAIQTAKQGSVCTLTAIENAPVIDHVFYYASEELQKESTESGFLVAHGHHLMCHDNLKLCWRAKGWGARPQDVALIHPETMDEYGLSHLMQPPESLAMLLPERSEGVMYLECWLGARPIGGKVHIDFSELRRKVKGPLLVDPRKWVCDVFLSHTGLNKDVANTLNRSINDTLRLRTFYDVASLKGKMGNDAIMEYAAKSAPVGVLLLSPPFFKKKWPRRELYIILRAGTQLPVWLGATYEELEESLDVDPGELSAHEWNELVTTLKNTTVIVQGDAFTANLMDKILFGIVDRCYQVCEKMGNDKRYNSTQMQQFRDRVLVAVEAVVDEKLDSLRTEDRMKAKEWRRVLETLNDEVSRRARLGLRLEHASTH